jgi:hypothetical protein
MLLTGHGRNSLWALEMDGTVPVLELLLQGRCTAGGVELTWRVSSAADATGFSIRRRLLPSGEFLAPAGGDLLPPSSDRFVDPGVLPGQTYEYRVTWVGQDGVALLSRAATVAVPAAPLVVSLQSSNPSRGTATFACGVPQPSPTSLIVYDSRGRFVRQLVHAPEATGKFTVEWDGRDDSGERVPSGVYFCRLLAAGRTSTARIVIAR